MEDNAYAEFASNTIGHLKDFLSARGLSCTGSKQQPKHLLSLPKNNNLADFRQNMTPG
jgi:hypothetical protein